MTRSENMRRITSRDTQPEMQLRRMLHSAGLRYRLHKKDLPGKPDIVFSRVRLIVFVHGCFWHRHVACKRSTIPQTNRSYWYPKLLRNQVRDKEVKCTLESGGWRVFVVWECQIKASVPSVVREITALVRGQQAQKRDVRR